MGARKKNRAADAGGDLLFRLVRCLNLVESDEARCCGLTNGQCLALLALRSGTPVGMGEVASSTGVSAGTATRIVDNLVRDGLAERVQDPEDRRKVCVRATAAGKKKIARLEDCFAGYWENIFGRVPAGKIRETLSALTALVEAVEGLRYECCGIGCGPRTVAMEKP